MQDGKRTLIVKKKERRREMKNVTERFGSGVAKGRDRNLLSSEPINKER